MLNEMDFAEFSRRAREGSLVPVYREVLADLLTPVSAFLKIGGPAAESFLLESVEGGERLARYSFLGRDPFLTVTISRGRLIVEDRRSGERREAECADPVGEIRALLSRYRAVRVPGLPRFTGGAVGCFAYDTVRWGERIPETTEDDLHHEDCVLHVYDTIMAFDHARRRLTVIANAHVRETDATGLQKSYSEARGRIEAQLDRLKTPLMPGVTGSNGPAPTTVTSNLNRADYEAMVARALEYIRAGDIFQVVLSQRFAVTTPAPPFDVYRALRAINPSPYMFFIGAPGRVVVGSSPEPLVQLQDGVLEYRPIAGTAPRGDSDEEDAERARAMLADDKERAEHVMLVDLGRNDLGRVAVPGSIGVKDLMVVERYSHVMHLVSRLTARLAPGRDALDVLFACLPAGTVSGAPKVRAMEIIDELEPTRRGLYSGAVGYLDFSGNLDTCIALRTMFVQDGTAYIQAGAGIVADSVPEREYQETVHKARALVSAVEMAGQGLE